MIRGQIIMRAGEFLYSYTQYLRKSSTRLILLGKPTRNTTPLDRNSIQQYRKDELVNIIAKTIPLWIEFNYKKTVIFTSYQKNPTKLERTM